MPAACAIASRWSWDDTVKNLGLSKKGLSRVPPMTLKASPAPSQSAEVMIGGCVCINFSWLKILLKDPMVSDRSRSRVELRFVRIRKCGQLRSVSGDVYFLWMGYVYARFRKESISGHTKREKSLRRGPKPLEFGPHRLEAPQRRRWFWAALHEHQGLGQ